MIFLKTNLKKGSDVMSKKNENINEEVKNAEETAEDIKDTETKGGSFQRNRGNKGSNR